MRNTSFAQKSATLAAAVTLLTGLAVTVASAQTPAPAPTPPATNYKVQYNGLIDGYYMYQFNDPHSSGLAGNNILPGDNSYAVRVNTPTLAEAELNVFKNAMPSGLGFHATLQSGDTPAIDHFAFNGANSSEGRYQNIQQLYATYAIGGNGAGIDFGKFYTPFGYEVVDANLNYNYTRSLPFFFLPVYHAGIRAYTPNIKGFTVTGIIANAMFNTNTAGVSDDHKNNYAYIGSLNYTDPKGKFVFITSDGYSEDKFNVITDTVDDGGVSKIFLSDNDFTYNATTTVTLGANFEYGDFKQSNNHNKEYGYAAYAKDQFSPKQALAARFSAEQVKFDGSLATSDAKPTEVTLTYEYKPASNFTTRLEYRHDSVSGNNGASAFVDSSGAITKKDQDLVILAGLFTF